VEVRAVLAWFRKWRSSRADSVDAGSGDRVDGERPAKWLLREAESLDVLKRVLAGEHVSDSDLSKLTEAHQVELWMWADPHVDIVALQLQGASAEDSDRVLYPYHRLLLSRWRDFFARMAYASQMAQKEAGARARRAAEAWPKEASPWSEALSEHDELRLWNQVDREAMDAWRVGEMHGMAEADILQRVYPNRRLLIQAGRPDSQAQLRYAQRMEAKASTTGRAGGPGVPMPPLRVIESSRLEPAMRAGAAADSASQGSDDAAVASDADPGGFRDGTGETTTGTRRRGRRPRVIAGLTPEASGQRCLELLALYRKGHSVDNLADQYGEPSSSICRWLEWGQQIEAERGSA
jgi:hypothetical protein